MVGRLVRSLRDFNIISLFVSPRIPLSILTELIVLQSSVCAARPLVNCPTTELRLVYRRSFGRQKSERFTVEQLQALARLTYLTSLNIIS